MPNRNSYCINIDWLISIPIPWNKSLRINRQSKYVEQFVFFSDARDLLRTWREDFVRRSDDVVDLWESYLRDSSTQLSDERWMILEQVKYALK